ncbi:hypothetical protein MRX96_033997 [Rhipicephalus microplus]
MITTALCHVLLPLVQTVCTVAPMEHAPSFYHYPNKTAVPLVLALPEKCIIHPTMGCSSHHRIPLRKGTLSSSPTIKEQRPSRPLCGLGGCATTLFSKTLVFTVQMITAALCDVLLPLVQTVCTVAPMESAPTIFPLPKQDCRSACLGFAGGTYIDRLLVDVPAIMGFCIQRNTVKFANYKGAAPIVTGLWARWLRDNAVF